MDRPMQSVGDGVVPNRSPAAGWLRISAVDGERHGAEGHSVGVGPVRAGIGAAKLIATLRPAGLVLVGTAGAYTHRHPVGTVILGARLGLEGGLSEVGLGYTPLPAEPLWGSAPEGVQLGALAADVLTVSAITTDPSLVDQRSADWAIEHMETYAVAAAAAAFHVPLVVLLGISNRVGPHAHAEWLAHRAEAERAALAAAQVWLDHLATRTPSVRTMR